MKPMLQCIIGSICSGVMDIPIRPDLVCALDEYQTNQRNSEVILMKIFVKSLGNEFMRVSSTFLIKSDR